MQHLTGLPLVIRRCGIPLKLKAVLEWGTQRLLGRQESYSRCPVTGAMPAWLAASAPITGIWKVLPW